MSLNNPAGRLLALLEEAGTPPKDSDRTPVRDRWAKVLGVDRNDRTALLARFGEVMALPSEVRAAVEAVPDITPGVYLKNLSKVEQTFGQVNLEAQWCQFARALDSNVMDGLEVCDELLGRRCPETTLPDDERERIHSQVRELFEEVRAEETDPNLREFLLRHLKAMDDALQEYKISGTPPVVQAAEAILGGTASQVLRRPEARRNPRLRKLFATALTALALTGGVEDNLALGERVLDALPTGESVEAQQDVEVRQDIDVHLNVEQNEDTQVESGGQPESEDEED